MKTLDRYIVRNFLFIALLWFLILMSLRVVVDMFVNLDEFTEHGLGFAETLSRIIEYYSYQTLVYFMQLGGVIIVLSAVFTIAVMNRTNELVAILASGVSLHRVILPIVICAMLLGGLIIIDQELLIPPVAPKLVRSHDTLDTSKTFAIRLISDSGMAAWYSPSFHPKDQVMDSPIVFLRDESSAPLGMIVGAKASPMTLRDVPGWRLTDARIVSARKNWEQTPTSSEIYTVVAPGRVLAGAAGGDLARIPPDRPVVVRGPKIADPVYGLTISAEAWEFGPVGKDGARPATLKRPVFTFAAPPAPGVKAVKGQAPKPLCEFVADSADWEPPAKAGAAGHWVLRNGAVFRASDLTRDDLELRKSRRWLDFMSSAELSRLLKLERVPDRQSAMLVRHVRFTEPINNLVMLLLGLPFVLSRERHIKASILLCILTVGAFFVLIYVCRYMDLPPTLSAWLPILLFGPVAVMMVDSVKT